MAAIIPSAVPSLASAVSTAIPDAAAIRTGTVSSIGSQYLGVRIADSRAVTDAGWLSSYQPVLGDVVAVARQGAAWTVLGTYAGTIEDNTEIANYGFEDGAVGSLPPYWQLVTAAGSPTLLTTGWPREDGIDGVQVAALTTAGAGSVSTELVSAPVQVLPGEQWAAAGSFRTWTNFGVATACQMQLYLSWYSSSSLSSLLSSSTSGTYPVTRGMGWQLVRTQGAQGYSVPPDAAYLRVRLSVTPWSAAAGDTIYFDRIIARRL